MKNSSECGGVLFNIPTESICLHVTLSATIYIERERYIQYNTYNYTVTIYYV